MVGLDQIPEPENLCVLGTGSITLYGPLKLLQPTSPLTAKRQNIKVSFAWLESILILLYIVDSSHLGGSESNPESRELNHFLKPLIHLWEVFWVLSKAISVDIYISLFVFPLGVPHQCTMIFQVS